MKRPLILGILLVMIILCSPTVFAYDDDDIEVFGLELEKLLNLASGILAAALAGLTYMASKRTRNKRLHYVTAAFALFALKAFLMGSELFFEEFPFIDPLTVIADFVILITFFIGILKK